MRANFKLGWLEPQHLIISKFLWILVFSSATLPEVWYIPDGIALTIMNFQGRMPLLIMSTYQVTYVPPLRPSRKTRTSLRSMLFIICINARCPRTICVYACPWVVIVLYSVIKLENQCVTWIPHQRFCRASPWNRQLINKVKISNFVFAGPLPCSYIDTCYLSFSKKKSLWLPCDLILDLL